MQLLLGCLRMLVLGTQPPSCEEAQPHRGAKALALSPSWAPSWQSILCQMCGGAILDVDCVLIWLLSPFQLSNSTSLTHFPKKVLYTRSINSDILSFLLFPIFLSFCWTHTKCCNLRMVQKRTFKNLRKKKQISPALTYSFIILRRWKKY